jgi:hypothetical protein
LPYDDNFVFVYSLQERGVLVIGPTGVNATSLVMKVFKIVHEFVKMKLQDVLVNQYK